MLNFIVSGVHEIMLGGVVGGNDIHDGVVGVTVAHGIPVGAVGVPDEAGRTYGHRGTQPSSWPLFGFADRGKNQCKSNDFK